MSDSTIRVPLAHYPRISPFILDWIAGAEKATRLLSRRQWSADVLVGAPERRRGRQRSTELAEALITSNRRWGAFVQNDVRRWAAGETVTIVAGQQVGFAGGPLYTLAKIATLLRMKRDLAARGVPATIFFWLATEDHDYAEVATLRLPFSTLPNATADRRQLDLLCLRAGEAIESRRAVGPLPIPEALIVEVLALYDLPRPEWLREGITFGDSFAQLLVTLCGNEIVFVDSLLPEVRRAAAPLFQSIFERWNDCHGALDAATASLAQNGYSPQVAQRNGERWTLLFRLDEGGVRRLLDSPEELGDPATISTSALTRPLLQDFVFEPDVFVGGPAEVAYYAQLTTLYTLLGVEMPAVALRGHLLVAPQRAMRAFSRYEIAPEEIFAPADEIVARREPSGIDAIRSIAEEARRDLSEAMTRIGELALPAEHSLARSISRSIGHIEYHFEKLTERAIRALARKDRERHAAVRELVATFHPDGHVQDRVVAWFPWWCHYRKHLLERMIEEIEPDGDSFKMVGL